MGEYLSFVNTSFLTGRAYGLIISNISQANNSSASLSKLTGRNRIAGSVRRLVADQFIFPYR